MSSFKHTFILEQLTPLIHFQGGHHDLTEKQTLSQEGATIRGSELKPKLDKFLIKHVFKNKFDNYKKYLVGWKYFASKKDEDDIKQSDFNGLALDYKVKIEASNEIKCPIAYRGKGIGAYFFMEEKDAKYSSMFEHVNVEILCMHEELLKELNHHRLEGGGFRCCGWKPPKAP